MGCVKMIKSILFSTILFSMIAGCVWAYPAPDIMGIYMDTEATGLLELCAYVDMYINLDLYLLISGPTGSQAESWEAKVQILTTVNYYGSWNIPDGGINVGSGDDFIVEHSIAPLLPNSVGNIVLMNIPLTVVDSSAPIEFYIGRVTNSETFQLGPGYSVTEGVSIPCGTSTNSPTIPVFIVNPWEPCFVHPGNEIATWSSVKDLYK